VIEGTPTVCGGFVEGFGETDHCYQGCHPLAQHLYITMYRVRHKFCNTWGLGRNSLNIGLRDLQLGLFKSDSQAAPGVCVCDRIFTG
jgi:hypothetical protein